MAKAVKPKAATTADPTAASTASAVAKAKPRGKPFQKGQSGNPDGRPVGSRNRLSEDFIKAFADDFGKHGVDVIEVVRAGDPVAYLRVAAGLIPKDVELKVDSSEAFQKLLELMQQEDEGE